MGTKDHIHPYPLKPQTVGFDECARRSGQHVYRWNGFVISDVLCSRTKISAAAISAHCCDRASSRRRSNRMSLATRNRDFHKPAGLIPNFQVCRSGTVGREDRALPTWAGPVRVSILMAGANDVTGLARSLLHQVEGRSQAHCASTLISQRRDAPPTPRRSPPRTTPMHC